MRFIAIASVSCASLLIEPKDIAPVAKRFTISVAGSTSSIGIGLFRGLQFHQPAQRAQFAALLIDQLRVFLERLEALLRTACCSLLTVMRIQQMILAADAVLILAADSSSVSDSVNGRKACSCFICASRARTSRPTPSIREAVPVKYFSIKRLVQADRLEHLRAAIALQRGDAHLREDLQQSLVDRPSCNS